MKMFKTVVDDYFDGNCHFGVDCYFNVNYGRPYVYVYCFSAKLSRYNTGFDEAFRLMMIHLT